MAIRGPKQADKDIGARLKAARMRTGLNQSDLARAASLTFQQIQKYEKGLNRISISTGLVMCKALGIKLEDLLPRELDDGTPIADPFVGQAQSIRGIKVARLFGDLDAAQQSSVLAIVESIAAANRAAEARAQVAA